MRLCNHREDYATPVVARWAPCEHPNTSSGHGMGTTKAVQMTQNWDNVFGFGSPIFTLFHMLQIEINHIGLQRRSLGNEGIVLQLLGMLSLFQLPTLL